MTNVVGVGLPVGLHLREEVGLEYALHLCHRALDRLLLLRIHVGIVRAIEVIQTGSNRVHPVRRGSVLTTQDFHSFSLEIRYRGIQPASREGLVQRNIRRQIYVRGTIMTIDTVHPALTGGGNLLR